MRSSRSSFRGRRGSGPPRPGWPSWGRGGGRRAAYPTLRWLAAAALFVAVFPANMKMTIDWSDRSTAEQALAWGRLPLQVPLVLLALKTRRDAAR